MRAMLTADRVWDGRESSASRQRLHVDGELLVSGPLEAEYWYTFPGCTILPGLIDTHVHLVMSALSTNEAIVAQVISESDDQLRERVIANAYSALRAGLTTVRDCGGRKNIVQQVRDRIRRGEIVGPDILACGAPITTTRGHCHWLGLTADSRKEVEVAAERMVAEHADFLKVMATGGNMTPSSDPMQAQYDAESLNVIAEIGRREHRHAAAHVLSRSALPAVVAARFRTIEHCDWRVEEFRYEFDPELARQIIDQRQFVGLTMSGLARRKFLPELKDCDAPAFRRLDARFACERQMIEFGVPFTIHSDAGVRLCPIGDFALGLQAAERELKLSPIEILRAVTSTAAEAIGLDDRGVLLPGKRADLLVVEGDPTRDLDCLWKVRAVMQNGRWVAGEPTAEAMEGRPTARPPDR